MTKSYGYNNKFEPRTANVDDPYNKGEKEAVAVNVRESSLTAMFHRKQLEPHQYHAGEWLRLKIEIARGIMGGAIDPSHEPVDTSKGQYDAYSIKRMQAVVAVNEAREAVGCIAWPILDDICGEGWSIREAAVRRYPRPSDREVWYTGKLFKEGLDVLAKYLNLSTR